MSQPIWETGDEQEKLDGSERGLSDEILQQQAKTGSVTFCSPCYRASGRRQRSGLHTIS